MAYIGNALTALIYNSNHRDDILPDGVSSTFVLGQAVPGGYEENILVFRRRYNKDILVQNTNAVSIDGTLEKITVIDDAIASALSLFQAPVPGVHPGDSVILSGCTNSQNNDVFPLLPGGVVYDGTQITLSINGNLITESGGSITITRGYVGYWEVLEPEIDYVIDNGPLGPNYHKTITFSEIPQEDDVIYVIHKGDATYAFTPSQNSVGPEQLQTNLRNFVCDRYTANGSDVTFALTQEAVNSKTLLVTLNGVESDGDDPDVSFVGAWQLDPGLTSITFHVAPAAATKIRILHLGFSTIARRAALSPGQVGALAPNSITATQLANNSVTEPKIDTGAVTNSKIGPDAVDGTKILLNNEESLRAKQNPSGTPTGLIRLNVSNQTVLSSLDDTIIERNGLEKLRVSNTAILPTGTTDVGSAGQKFRDGYFTGNLLADTLTANTSISTGAVNATTVTATGNISSSGGDVSGNNGSFSNVNTSTINGAPLTNLGAPTGSIVATGRTTAPTGWLLCDGSVVSQTTYADLFAAIAVAFNIGGEGPGTFRLPDLRQRFPLGKAASGTGSVLGAAGGAIDHTHTAPAHTHDLSNHFHNLPAHYHALGSGADLNIGTSGSHTTSIDISHSHSASLGSSTTGFTFSISINPVGDHIHTGTTSTDGAHTHNVATRSGGGSNPYKPDSNQGARTASKDFDTDSAGNHSHSIITFGAGSHGHSTTVIYNDPGHSHSISVSALGTTIRNDTNGQHNHPTGTFAGRIGNVSSGNDGNGTYNSGTPSNNNTSSAGALPTTASNPPYLVLNYIIKT